jgi:hypothetical protein
MLDFAAHGFDRELAPYAAGRAHVDCIAEREGEEGRASEKNDDRLRGETEWIRRTPSG